MSATAALLDEEMDEDCEIEDKKERGAIEYLNCEGDGVFDNIYEVLWTKQEGGRSIDVVVPDTVVFKFNKPTGWYYTKVTKNAAFVLHKKRLSSLRMGLILHHFQNASAASCSDVVAYYISQVDMEAEQSGQRASQIHYLAKQELERFLLHTKNKNGILQRFVDPKPSTSSKHHNTLVRCSWTQSVCLVERRSNVHDLKPPSVPTQKHPRLSRYDRAETFEGDFRNSNEYPLTSLRLLEQIQTVCQRIVAHYAGVALGRLGVSRMVVNFKFDRNTRLHFLWCESLRIERNVHPVTGAFLAPPPSVIGASVTRGFSLANKLKVPPRDRQLESFVACRFCGHSGAASEFVTAQYHTLLSAVDDAPNPASRPNRLLERLKERWARAEEAMSRTGPPPPSPRKQRVRPWAQKKEPAAEPPPEAKDSAAGMTVDESSFTRPVNVEQGLLAHIDERQLLKDPMAALALAAREWGERVKREREQQEAAQASGMLTPKDQALRLTQTRSMSKGALVSDNDLSIPWFVKFLHPYMTGKDWSELKGRSDFQKLQVTMCDSCYVSLVEGLGAEGPAKRRAAQRPCFGPGRDAPSVSPPRRLASPGSAASRRPLRGLHGTSRLMIPCNVRFPLRLSDYGLGAKLPGMASPDDESIRGSPYASPKDSREGSKESVKGVPERQQTDPQGGKKGTSPEASPRGGAMAALLAGDTEGIVMTPLMTGRPRRRKRESKHALSSGTYCRSSLLRCARQHAIRAGELRRAAGLASVGLPPLRRLQSPDGPQSDILSDCEQQTAQASPRAGSPRASPRAGQPPPIEVRL
eukprot:Hpha_TRINITY_DN16956_c2_g4::TRINITY_DN16956_c2_g4_i1::g.54197::m.54197